MTTPNLAPANLVAERGKPMQALLDALPEDGCRTCAELAAVTGLSPHKVADRCSKLRVRGLIETPRPGCYRLTPTGRIARAAGTVSKSGPKGALSGRRRPKRRTLAMRIWTALRTLDKASLPDLLALAAQGEKRAEDGARRYLKALRAAGYVTVLPRREPGTAPTSNGFLRYMLVRDTGPLAPVVSPKHGDLSDPNTGARIPLRLVREPAP